MGCNTNNRGLSKTPTYLTWNAMRRRCYLGSIGKKPAYSGVSYCEKWKSFENFVADMGERPEGTTLDRIDPTGDYCPENCRWETNTRQQRNKRNNRTLTYNGVTKSLHDWAEEVGIGAMTLHKRLTEYGWDPEMALFTSAYGNHKGTCKNNGKQKDHSCPSCGLVGSKGNVTQHIQSAKNTCSGQPLQLI